jgi:hypothetical protein
VRLLQISALKIPLALALPCFVLGQACSKEVDSKDQQAENASSAPEEDVVSDKPVVSLTAGIPEICSLTENENLSCIRCKPREIPILKCADKKLSTLVALENCTFDDKIVSCVNLESDFELRLDYKSHSTKEKYYLNLEEVVGGIKFLVGATLKDETGDDRILLFFLLDTLVKYKRDIFLGLNSDKIVDELMLAFIAKKPNLSEERRGKTRASIKKAVDLMTIDVDESIKGSTSVIMFINNIVEAMKVGNEGTDLGNVQVSKLVELMNSPKYKDMIDQLLASFITP